MSHKDELNNKSLLSIKDQLDKMSGSLSLLNEFKEKLTDLQHTQGIPGLAKASPKQRGYIHGLCKKLEMDEDELDVEVRDMSVIEASEAIEELKFYADGMDRYSGYKDARMDYYSSHDFDPVYDDDELPF
jgi:hypothetical protein